MTETTSGGYQVLARKYRPATFADLIGQDANCVIDLAFIDNDDHAHAAVKGAKHFTVFYITILLQPLENCR